MAIIPGCPVEGHYHWPKISPVEGLAADGKTAMHTASAALPPGKHTWTNHHFSGENSL